MTIEAGQVFKNYRLLCAELGEPIKEGDSKKAQLKEFHRFFDFERVGQKYLITEIFDNPLPKTDKRSLGNTAIYIKYIELITMQLLVKQKDYTYTTTRNNLYKSLGMVNQKFSNQQYYRLLIENKSIKSFDINHFNQRVNQKLNVILFSALNNLKNRCLLNYYEEIIIVENGNMHHKANDFEIKQIINVQKQVLNELGLLSLNHVFLKFKNDQFYSRVNELLYDKCGWLYTFKQYKIIYTKADIIIEIPITELQLQRLILNENVISVINQQAENNYEKNQIKYEKEYENFIKDYIGFGEPLESDFKFFKYRDDYIEIQKELSEFYLKI
ncbi:MAG: hypothetical protein CVU91_10490 [Firmicutes bacterium HGW-Firmicutes-16]|nr:MAG: hypothetical protein CVU91_10490 [Firmicutes bacterium HGW-Firmicutes-16]